MKNLTIKKVALGILLAGYAASGAFAVTATTSNTIIGNAPNIYQPSTTTPGFKYVIERQVGSTWKDISTFLTTAEKNAREGDRITIKFKYTDGDSDEADNFLAPTGAGNGTHAFKLYVYDTTTTAAVTGTTTAPTLGTAAIIGTDGEYQWTIPTGAAGSDKQIGITLVPISKFGDPRVGTALSNNNMITAAGTGGGTTPPTWPTINPGTTTLGIHIIKQGTTNYYGTSMTAAQSGYTAATVSPKLSETFEVEAFDKTDGTGSSVTIAGSYGVQWSIAPSDINANGVTVSASTVDISGETAATITLPSNNTLGSAWATAATGTQAGVQGYKLSVTLN